MTIAPGKQNARKKVFWWNAKECLCEMSKDVDLQKYIVVE